MVETSNGITLCSDYVFCNVKPFLPILNILLNLKTISYPTNIYTSPLYKYGIICPHIPANSRFESSNLM